MKSRSASYHIEDSLLFKVFSLVFFVGLLAYTGYQLKLKRDAGLQEAGRRLETIEALLREAYRVSGSFRSDTFRDTAREALADTDALLALSIVGSDGAAQYALARDARLLDGAPQNALAFRALPVLDGQVSRPFGEQRLVALFRVLDREALYPLLRDVLIILLAFILAVVLFILIALSVSPQSRSAGEERERERWDDDTDWPPAPEEDLFEEPRAAPGGPPAPGRPPERSLFSPSSGLVRGEYLEERLQFELERSAAFDQDLTLVLVAPDAEAGRGLLEEACRQTARVILEKFPFKDMVFEGGDNGIALILPDKHLDQAIAEMEALRRLFREKEGPPRSVSIGLSSRNGRLLGQKILLREARAALARAVQEGGNRLTAFRADPDKFRKVVTSLR